MPVDQKLACAGSLSSWARPGAKDRQKPEGPAVGNLPIAGGCDQYRFDVATANKPACSEPLARRRHFEETYLRPTR